MANVQLSAALAAIRGRVGDVVFKKRKGKLYISRRPDFSKRRLSAAQKRSVARFKAAVRHAKEAMRDPNAAKPFERLAKKNGKTVYHTIISEYMNQSSQ